MVDCCDGDILKYEECTYKDCPRNEEKVDPLLQRAIDQMGDPNCINGNVQGHDHDDGRLAPRHKEPGWMGASDRL